MADARVWAENLVAKASAGFRSSPKPQTLIKAFCLAALGPEKIDLKDDLKKHLVTCLGLGLDAAKSAFSAAESPEIGVRLAAAYAAFQASVRGCLSVNRYLRDYYDRFELTYVERAYWEDGLNLELTIENPNAALYVQLRKIVGDNVPDPINRLIEFYIASTSIPEVHVDLKIPTLDKKFLVRMPERKDMERYVTELVKHASKAKKVIDDEVRRIESASRGSVLGIVRLREEVGLQAIAEGIRLAKGFYNLVQQKLPAVVNGRVVFAPVVADVVRPLLPPSLREAYEYFFGTYTNPVEFVNGIGKLFGGGNSVEYFPVTTNNPDFDKPAILSSDGSRSKASKAFAIEFSNYPKGLAFSVNVSSVRMELQSDATRVLISCLFNCDTGSYSAGPAQNAPIPIFFYRARRKDEEADRGAEGQRVNWKLLNAYTSLDWCGKHKCRQNVELSAEDVTRPLMLPREVFHVADMVAFAPMTIRARTPC